MAGPIVYCLCWSDYLIQGRHIHRNEWSYVLPPWHYIFDLGDFLPTSEWGGRAFGLQVWFQRTFGNNHWLLWKTTIRKLRWYHQNRRWCQSIVSRYVLSKLVICCCLSFLCLSFVVASFYVALIITNKCGYGVAVADNLIRELSNHFHALSLLNAWGWYMPNIGSSHMPMAYLKVTSWF